MARHVREKPGDRDLGRGVVGTTTPRKLSGAQLLFGIVSVIAVLGGVVASPQEGSCQAGDPDCTEPEVSDHGIAAVLKAAESNKVVRYPDETNGLPIFDLARLAEAISPPTHTDGEDAGVERMTAAAALRDALLNKGIFYIENTGVEVETLARTVREATKPYFDLPSTEAEHLTRPGTPPRGLAPLESESVAALLGVGTHTDFATKWSLGNNPKFENVWPEGDADFKEKWIKFQDEGLGVSSKLFDVITTVLGLANTTAADAIKESGGESNIRHIHYPDVPPARCSDSDVPPERMAAHHDLDIFTLVHQTPCDNEFVSLQGQFGGSKDWIGVPPVPGTLVVTCGEVLSIISGGQVTATTHRVTVPPSSLSVGSARTTTALFWQPHPDFKVNPPADSHFTGGYDFPEDGIRFEDWISIAFSNLASTQKAST